MNIAFYCSDNDDLFNSAYYMAFLKNPKKIKVNQYLDLDEIRKQNN